jgi:hypothetical protein
METFGFLSFPGLLKDRIQAIEQAFEETAHPGSVWVGTRCSG